MFSDKVLEFNRETPTVEQLKAYGELLFLRWMTDAFPYSRGLHLASSINAAVNVGFFKVFYSHGRPIGYFTYAFLSDATTGKFFLDLKPDDVARDDLWNSGVKLWAVDFVGHNPTIVTKMYKDFRENSPRDTIYSIRTYDGKNMAPRVCIRKRVSDRAWRSKYVGIDTIILELSTKPSNAFVGEKNV